LHSVRAEDRRSSQILVHTLDNTNEPYLEWANFALAQSSLPQVISTSYGDDEQSVPRSYATTVCGLFAQLGARGVSLLFSSGDYGIGADGTCYSNDGKDTPTFLPVFPASCPYATAVGGTRNLPEIVVYNPESPYISGSGFSNYFTRPSYQDGVVPPYISRLNGKHDRLYNKSGRAFPGISAQGFHFVIIWNGTLHRMDGTSCSGPAASSVISVVNDTLIAAGKPVLGFLNPVR
jgi:tripeptidyl-peptidase-1